MATLLIRGLQDSVKETIRVRGAQNGRSMEAEARVILEGAVGVQEPQQHLYHRIRGLVAKYGPMDLEIPAREVVDDPPEFD